MEMKGSRVVPTDVDATWLALNDPNVLRACIPGCETIERTSDTEYQVTMTARVGPVNAKFRGRLSLADLVPPQSYMLRFEGQGGAAGFANGTARVALAPAEAGTRVDYAVSAQVGGKLAQIGSRLIDGVAAKLADDFFTRFGERASAEPTAEEQAAGAPPAQLAAALHTMRTRLLLAAVIVAAIAIYWWLHSA
jgi:carbon monoxide dehydrogenase subunit G